MLSIPLLRWLWAGAAVLVVGHVVTLVAHVQYGVPRDVSLPRQLDLNAEGNLAAWYESFLLLCCALLVLALAAHARERGAPLAHRWVALAGVIGLMAVDETAQLHDMFTGPLRRGLALDFGLFYFAWLIPAVAFLAVCGWYFAPLALSLPGALYRRLIAAAGVYFGGSIVVEMVSGYAVESGRQSTPYLAVLTLEETCEIVGLLLAVGTLLAFLRSVQPRLVIALDEPGTIGFGTADRPATLIRNENLF